MFYSKVTLSLVRAGVALVVLPALVACGGGSDNNSNSDNNGDQGPSTLPTSVPELNWLGESSAKLKKASSSELSSLLKNGAYLSRVPVNETDSSLPVNASPVSDGESSPGFSSTNVVEAGVDEGDRIEYDGDYLYIAAHSEQELSHSAVFRQYVRVMKRTDQGIEEITQIEASDSLYSHQGLYLHEGRLASVFKYPVLTLEAPTDSNETASTSPSLNTFSNTFELSFADVSSPEQPQVINQYRIEGSILDSRVIGSELYVVSQYHAAFDTDETDELAIYQALYQANVLDLIPKIKDLNSGEESPLFDASACYIPTDATESDSENIITTITKISMQNPTSIESTCINAPSDGVYASQESIYLHKRFWPSDVTSFDDLSQTALHKFSLDGGKVAYSASGAIEGSLGFGGNLIGMIEPILVSNVSNAAFRLSEYNSQLRVVTTRFSESKGMVHQLFVLQQQGTDLEEIARLPNEAHPTPIGKVESNGMVEENIYAVRFMGERAYVVTFRQIDPLYVLDLSKADEPIMAGALEIPGYSAYLHPVSDELLIGVGQNVDDFPFNASDDSSTDIAPNFGAKVSLFDVSDMTSPSLIKEHVFAGGYTPVEFDHHAFSYLKVSDQTFRMTLPVESWEVTIQDDNTSNWGNKNELAAFEVSTADSGSLTYIGSSVATYDEPPQSVPYVRAADDRGVIHGDTIFYVHGNFVWSSLWQSPDVNAGPF
ncbi:beta-propeller domain-containing protein [Pseudoalteromonas luteoviolacea]|uniref:beta-propeller domain-containing protein n=1 Tax=Pseudoalteromonas luteoviolacea TaxID=43657 RepID=UPI001B39FA13|nr:beta-propeller domain-containing protein [Pseudoalteromonas luteoviolacea]MBQ4878050.1 beta-propeller domain-containing protein [Pseudoalteromonas luteoviolacea]MBQ4907096.1 beta-propeller domain-containing protein [Pseudoalteromonas luteoviolacea]